MNCRRAFDVDLVACLLDRGRPEWQPFRDHYPTCPECAAEVRAWTELEEELAPPHPAPERLVAFADEPARLPPEERHAVRGHVERCVGCRDELATLRTTDVAALVRAGHAAAGPATREPAARPAASLATLGAWLRDLVWHPAFAYGIALALLLPHLARLLPDPAGFSPLAPAPTVRASARTVAAPAPTERGAENPAAAAWPFVTLEPGTMHAVTVRPPGLAVALPVPTTAAPPGLAELRARDAAGRRELREQHFGPPARAVSMRLPAAWLEPGRYRIELWLDGAAPAAAATLDVVP